MTAPKKHSYLRQVLEAAPLLRQILERRYEKRFAGNCRGCFRGVYETFAQADLSSPRTKPRGFNCPEYAQEFKDRRSRVFSFDYPVLFWLKCLLVEGSSIFDFGGHVGTQFYAYSKYLQFPPAMRWVVCDLPEITRAGAELAQEQGQSGLTFTNRFEDAKDSDIFLAAGSVQYVESPPLAERLSKLERKPAHLLVNKLPVYDGEQFVTLQNGGAAFHPQHVFNRAAFLESLTSLGYEVVDSWDVETHPGYIPFHPENSFRCHSGFYLRLSQSHPATT